ncbi:MAG: TVP38/TMEM64 family protein [Clostridia bacterium]|nr:TVP38/TMEM64 family protein [Clostridia bacterium]
MKKKVSKLKIVSIILVILIALALTVALIPIFASYDDHERLTAYIESFGTWGAFVLLAIQVFQIVVALIPGELVEFVAGALYKTVLGTLICILGVALGEFLVFKFVRLLSRRNPDNFKIPEKFEKLKFLNDKKKLEYIIFLLFFIPGTPKDVLTYFVPLTKIDMKRFLILSCTARIPAILSSTYAGATFAQGDLLQTAAIYAVIGAVSLIGIFVHNRFINKGEKHGRK